MPDRPATLRDVAAAARVHPATASRALNPETRILVSEDTARRVLERGNAEAAASASWVNVRACRRLIRLRARCSPASSGSSASLSIVSTFRQPVGHQG